MVEAGRSPVGVSGSGQRGPREGGVSAEAEAASRIQKHYHPENQGLLDQSCILGVVLVEFLLPGLLQKQFTDLAVLDKMYLLSDG